MPGRGSLRPALDLREESVVRAAYRAHGAELYRFALRLLDDEGSAADVVQEVFLRAWRSADRYDPEVASLRVWLFAIARNVVVDQLRRRRVRPVAVSAVVDDQPQAAFDDVSITGCLVEEALRRLRPEHRSALVETYLRQRPYAEVAAEQGVPIGTLRSRVFYGLKALRVAMDEMGVQP